MLPFGLTIPTVVTIHDLIHIYHPEHFYYPYIASKLITSALRRATRILTVSHASAEQINKFSNNLYADKLRVAPNAVDPYFAETITGQSPEIFGRYFFSNISTDKPHKGISDLIEAFRKLKTGNALASEMRLVIAGQGTSSIKVNDPDIFVLGEVPKDRLRRLYREALAVVVPSVLEGSSLPSLEAQASGRVVISRPVPAIFELLTPRDLVARDFTVEALTEVMGDYLHRRCSDEPQLGFDLARHIKRFSRYEFARKVFDVYMEAAGENTARMTA
jgi:glycosyltransferase involved in cell wall biosynthesis